MKRTNDFGEIEQAVQDEQIISKEVILTEIVKLKPKYKEVILLYYYQELSIKEIADVLQEKESIPELAPMHIVGVQQVEGNQVDEVSIEKRYDNMMELEQDLGVKLLGTAHSKENPYISVQYKKMGEGYNLINVSNYETGDLQNLKVYKDDGDASETQGCNGNYIWTIGEIYKTPIDLEIEII